MNRTIAIENYLPSVVRGVDEFQQIAKAQNPEFNLLQERIVRTFSERFIQTATEYGVKRWESLLFIIPKEGETLEQRKERILTYLNIKLPYSWRMLENMLKSYLGENNFILKYDIEKSKLSLTLNWLSFYAFADIESLLDKIVPMNVIIDVHYRADAGNLSLNALFYVGGKLTMNRTIFIK